jgi:hypothetical protein
MDKPLNIVKESALTYGYVNDLDTFRLMDAIRAGINFPDFTTIAR